MKSRGGDVFGGEFWRDGGVRGGGVAPYPGPGIGVLEDVHLKIVLKLRLAGHPDIVIVMPVLIPGIPLLHVSFADSLYGSVQVRHVDAAVGKPASSHECERGRPQEWFNERVQSESSSNSS